MLLRGKNWKIVGMNLRQMMSTMKKTKEKVIDTIS